MTDIYLKPESASLKARLRKRSDDDRKIQANNEAVAAALRGQRLLFEQGVRSDSNTFAMRLCMDYERCARNDATLAEDWAEAADRIEQLEAALEQSQAEVAAAYERAAELVKRAYDAATKSDELACSAISRAHTAIRALSTTDQTAALDTLRAEARAQGMREAVYIAFNACLVLPDGGSPTEEERLVCDEAYNRILEAITKGAKA